MFSGVSAIFGEALQNTVARPGEGVTLCRSKTEQNASFQWTARSKNETSKGINIHDGYSPDVEALGYYVSQKTGNVCLIFNASIDKALTYTATEIGYENNKQNAEFIVLGKNENRITLKQI